MIEASNKMEFASAEKNNSIRIQWQWLPLLLAVSGIWFYGLWCLAIKVF
jgi:hypothetical protein